MTILSTLEAPGHRGGIRAVALSGDDSLILSAAAEGVKLWNARSGSCVRTLQEPQHVLCALFATGNRHAVVGTKVGWSFSQCLAALGLLRSIQGCRCCALVGISPVEGLHWDQTGPSACMPAVTNDAQHSIEATVSDSLSGPHACKPCKRHFMQYLRQDIHD